MREPIEEARSGRLARRDQHADPAPEREDDSFFSLQQTAGNTAVAELLGGHPASAGVEGPGGAGRVGVIQREGLWDELKKRRQGGGSGSGPAPGKDAGAAGAGAPAGSGGRGFEAGIFQGSVVAPLRAIANGAQGDAPDHPETLAQLKRIGPTLNDTELKYRGKDEFVADRLNGVRGWLGQVYNELHARFERGRPMTDKEIGSRLGDAADNVTEVAGRMK